MKKILIALLLSFASAAHAADIASLNCVASNGVVLKGASNKPGPLKVESQWGIYKKEFLASINPASNAETTLVSLVEAGGGSYVIALPTPKVRKFDDLKLSGTILKPSDVRGEQPSLVAYVSCELHLR